MCFGTHYTLLCLCQGFMILAGIPLLDGDVYLTYKPLHTVVHATLPKIDCKRPFSEQPYRKVPDVALFPRRDRRCLLYGSSV